MTHVSRETAEKFADYANLLRTWSRRINLVAPSTLNDLEQRHLQDCVQLDALAPDWRHWCDLGSGGGLPGLVISMLHPDKKVTLIESDRRKSVFLSHVARTLSLNVTVVCDRIETAAPQDADIVSARALAPLTRLIPLAERHGHPQARYLFPKGVRWQKEVAEARAVFAFDVDAQPSITDKDAIVLIVENIDRV